MPPSVEIPDGSPDSPSAALMFAIGIRTEPIGRVIVTNDISHQSVGDLLGNLSHQDQFAVLNTTTVTTAPPIRFSTWSTTTAAAGSIF